MSTSLVRTVLENMDLTSLFKIKSRREEVSSYLMKTMRILFLVLILMLKMI